MRQREPFGGTHTSGELDSLAVVEREGRLATAEWNDEDVRELHGVAFRLGEEGGCVHRFVDAGAERAAIRALAYGPALVAGVAGT
jgi:hypothetical protein